ncbi:MAG TPA: hypothetical protein VEY12_00615 [Thermoplasmata archaeon]|nr:hypothetical protein [Thermoplasmata archaeon]
MAVKGKHVTRERLAAIALIVIAGALLVGVAMSGFGVPSSRSGPVSAGVVSTLASSGQIATGVGIFTEATIALTVGMLFIGAFSLQIARNYFLRTLDKFTLRLGADIWWLAYIMIRDGLMFGALLLGFELFFVGTYGDYAIAVPFMPLAIVLTAAVLVIKLVRDPDEEEKSNRLVSTLIAAATFFYVFGILMVTESIAGYGNAGYLVSSSGAITTATGGSDIWTTVYNAFSSTVNTQLAIWTFYVCFTALSAFAAYAFVYVTKPDLLPFRKAPEKKKAEAPATREKVVAPASEKAN